ncbi:MAG: IS1380 family transposase [Candidatus Dormibacteraeota bacterium]|nr:IS1380 family transposase [Candidatus Dormibacteraeota bacterium]
MGSDQTTQSPSRRHLSGEGYTLAPPGHVSADDPSLTGRAGLMLSGELAHRLELVGRLDTAIGAVREFKQRRRVRSAGELLVSLAEMILTGGSHLAHLEVLRQDAAGAELRAVAAVPPASTAGQLLRRLNRRQCQVAITALAEAGNGFDADHRRDPGAPVSLDLDATGTEVYGRRKQGAEFTYEGKRSYLSQFCTWSERGRVLAAELLRGKAAPSRSAVALVRRALEVLPAGHGPVSLRADSDYYILDLLHFCRRRGVRFAVSVARSSAMWRALEGIAEEAWQQALEMPWAEVAETTYAPQGWRHEPLRLLIRRVRLDPQEVSRSPRARRRRTIPAEQLALALARAVDVVYGYSFILTDRAGSAVEEEPRQRRRAHVEERVRDERSNGLIHLPLGTLRANSGWLVATVLATNLMAMLSTTVREVAREAEVPPEFDPQGDPTYRTSPVLRRWLILVPGRLVHRSRQLLLRLPRGWWRAEIFTATYQRLRLVTVT